MSFVRHRPQKEVITSPQCIPPRVPMIWQLTVPSSDEVDLSSFHQSAFTEIEPVGYEPLWVQNIHALQHKFDDEPLSIHTDKEHIGRTLNQYNKYTSYSTYSSIVLHGYVRRLQREIDGIIPVEIANICLSFYFEEESDFIYTAYDIYKQLKSDYFSGQMLTSVLKTNKVHLKCGESIADICNNLIQYKFIEMVSYRTHFSALFAKHEDQLYDHSSNCTYRFTSDVFLSLKKYFDSKVT